MERSDEEVLPPAEAAGATPEDPDEREATRRDVMAAVIVTIVSALLIGFLWLISHGAPSAGRDPNFTPLVPEPTRVPTVAATPLTPAHP